MQREPRLAQAAHAQQRDQARFLHQRLDLVEFAFASDERGTLKRQVVGDVAHRHPPVRIADDAIDLLTVRRWHEALILLPDLEQLKGIGHALDHPVTVRLELQPGLTQGLSRLGGQQRLPTMGDGHDSGRCRLGQAVHLQRLGAASDIVGAVLPQDDRPDMQAGACLQGGRHRGQCTVVGHGVLDCLVRLLEQQQHPVGLVDLAPVPGGQQVARDAVMRGPDLGHCRVADLFRQLGAVDHIGQEEGADVAHRGCRWSRTVYGDLLQLPALQLKVRAERGHEGSPALGQLTDARVGEGDRNGRARSPPGRSAAATARPPALVGSAWVRRSARARRVCPRPGWSARAARRFRSAKSSRRARSRAGRCPAVAFTFLVDRPRLQAQALRLAYDDGEADGPRSYAAPACAVKGLAPA